jgi:polysaccharide pyruvyl transferase WcaK-like protein
MKRPPHFLLVGNGPYSNRGCEAIVRGTMTILRRQFGGEFRVTLGTLEASDRVSEQAARESDPLITHLALRGTRIARWSPPWWRRQIARPFRRQAHDWETLDSVSQDAACALQIGGDNYTLDYGPPREFMRLDDSLRRRGVPVVLWGASVGPFEAAPAFAPEMFAHLQAMRAICVRESDSYEYLNQHGLGANLHRMSDPAFLMEPVEPPVDKLQGVAALRPPDAARSGPIGLNLSPMMAKHVTHGDMEAWVRLGADIVRRIVKHTQRGVLLVPHVTWPQGNDHAFLRRVAAHCPEASAGHVCCLGENLSAAETKWVISRCAVFAGARTHSTIAAISSAVPTLSFAYSRKARGLNRDIFGCQDYCLQPAEISPETVAGRLADLLAKRDGVADYLARSLPAIRERALHGGTVLRRFTETP